MTDDGVRPGIDDLLFGLNPHARFGELVDAIDPDGPDEPEYEQAVAEDDQPEGHAGPMESGIKPGHGEDRCQRGEEKGDDHLIPGLRPLVDLTPGDEDARIHSPKVADAQHHQDEENRQKEPSVPPPDPGRQESDHGQEKNEASERKDCPQEHTRSDRISISHA